jgi:TonB family protein
VLGRVGERTPNAGTAREPGEPEAILVEPSAVGDSAAERATLPSVEGVPPVALAGARFARLDTGLRGRGGDATVPTPAINLADADEQMRLSPDLTSRIDRDQLQRIRVSRLRASWEDRRATTHPAELTFVSTGPYVAQERRPAAAHDPARGAMVSPRADAPGGLLGSSPDTEAEWDSAGRRAPGAPALGAASPAPGEGVSRSAPGEDHRTSARVGTARPLVVAAAVSVPAAARGRPEDDVDSQQEVATTVRSLVHASTAGGEAGLGAGGSAGAVPVGSGGDLGEGSDGRPLGLSDGDVYDYWTSDPRLLPYFRHIHARIDPLWAHAFPKSAMLELKQGTVILEFTVFADGHAIVSWPPLRPSGIDEFDRNCAEAIRRASPFGPIPRELGVKTLRIRAPFVASNPIVK